MAKLIKLTQQTIDDVVAEFTARLTGKMSTGKISFTKDINKVAEKAELFFEELAWYKMQSLVRTYSTEVGWHGVCKKLEKGKFVISDILVYPQVVSGVTVTPDLEKYSMWLMGHPDEVFNNIRFQGHSHVNLACTPSAVDEQWYENILSQLDDTMFYVFMIVNKKGDMFVRIYDMAENIMYETADVSTQIYEGDLGIESFIRSVEPLVTKEVVGVQTPAVYNYGGNCYGGYGYGGYDDDDDYPYTGYGTRGGYGSYTGYYNKRAKGGHKK